MGGVRRWVSGSDVRCHMGVCEIISKEEEGALIGH